MDCIHCGQNVYTHGSACRIPPAIISRTMAPCHDCAAKDAEIAKLRAERDEVKRTLVSLFDDTKAEMKRLRADLDQARRDRNSAVECAEVLRGYVAEHKAALAAARAVLDGERGRADSYRESHKPTSGCVDRIYAGGVLGPIQIDNRCGLCKAHDKLRAAEAKCDGCDSTRARCDGAKAGGAIKCCPECGHGAAEAKASRGGDHIADAGQMVAAAQEPKP